MSGSAKIDENKKKHYIDPLRDYDQSPTPEADDLWVSKSSGSEGNAGGHSGKKKAKEKKEKKGKKKEGKAKKKEKGETKQSGGEEQVRC
jgi:hypothetical protein